MIIIPIESTNWEIVAQNHIPLNELLDLLTDHNLIRRIERGEK